MIEVSLEDTVYKIIKDHPEVKEIMIELGFDNIVKPKLLKTVGKLMTISKGCMMQGIELYKVQEMFEINGLELK